MSTILSTLEKSLGIFLQAEGKKPGKVSTLWRWELFFCLCMWKEFSAAPFCALTICKNYQEDSTELFIIVLHLQPCRRFYKALFGFTE